MGLSAGAKEGGPAKRNWLRGLLLGVSMGLLFAGGVAAAQGPVCDDDVSIQGQYEEFGDGWSQHWTDGDNAAGLHFV
jgi:hypothetical protein